MHFNVIFSQEFLFYNNSFLNRLIKKPPPESRKQVLRICQGGSVSFPPQTLPSDAVLAALAITFCNFSSLEFPFLFFFFFLRPQNVAVEVIYVMRGCTMVI